MSRSIWAAVGACALALATMPGVALAKGSGSSPQIHGGKTPAAAIRHSGRRHPHHIENRAARQRRRRAPRAGHGAGHRAAHRAGQALVLGTGYLQARGSGRVRSLQRRLAHLGFAPGPIDGRYGPLTTNAVKRLQAAASLTVDGVAGPRTMAIVASTRRAVLAPGAGYHRLGGSRRVRALQRHLLRLGFAPGPIDGRYGPLTANAIRRFQRRHHVAVTGVVGMRTSVDLRTVTRRQPITRSTPAPLPTVPVARPPVVGRPQPGTTLPVGLVLLALAAVGLAAAAHSYWSTRRRLQTMRGGSTGDRRTAGGPQAQGSECVDSQAGGPPRKPRGHSDLANSREGAR